MARRLVTRPSAPRRWRLGDPDSRDLWQGMSMSFWKTHRCQPVQEAATHGTVEVFSVTARRAVRLTAQAAACGVRRPGSMSRLQLCRVAA